MGELQKILSTLEDLGLAVLAISPDSPEDSAKLKDRIGTSITLLSDPDLILMRKFGSAFKSGRRALPVPAGYLVDASGSIAFHFVHPDYSVRLDPDVLIAAAKSVVKE